MVDKKISCRYNSFFAYLNVNFFRATFLCKITDKKTTASIYSIKIKKKKKKKLFYPKFIKNDNFII